MLSLAAIHKSAIIHHAEEIYPLECCGILLGQRQGSRLAVTEVRRAGNLNAERAHDRYEMDPKDQVKAEKDARRLGLEVLGYYHSHPDHPALPSSTDNSLSWEGYAYLIISVNDKKAGDLGCFSRGSAAKELQIMEWEVLP